MFRRHSRARPSLTVITPTYNRASYLPETLDSVFAQNYPNLTYIVIDDGSADNTAEVMRRYRGRVLYSRHDNIGETRTVNRALKRVETDYFMIVNSDDPLLPGCLATMVEHLEASPQALAAYPDWKVIGPKSEEIIDISVGAFDLQTLLTSINVPIGPGACFRRAVLELVGYRNPLLRYSADLEYRYRLSVVGQMLHVPGVWATHRVHPDSASVTDRGNLLARETRFLFQVYANHPRAPADRARARALANGHFAAAFVCSTRIDAARQLVRALLANPTVALERLSLQSAPWVADALDALPGTTTGDTARLFAAAIAAPTRRKAYWPALRALLQDGPGIVRLAHQHGIPDLMDRVRRMPTI